MKYINVLLLLLCFKVFQSKDELIDFICNHIEYEQEIFVFANREDQYTIVWNKEVSHEMD